MKENRGFTLVELLAIVVLLGIIALVAAPNMTKQIKKKEEVDQTILDEKISNAAHLYVAKYYADKVVKGECKKNSSDNPCKFTLNDLELDGLIDLKGKCSNASDKEIYYNSNEKSYDFSKIQNKNNNITDCASSNIK